MVLTRAQDETIFQHLIHHALQEPDDGSSVIKNSLIAHNISRVTLLYAKYSTFMENLTMANASGKPSQACLLLGDRCLLMNLHCYVCWCFTTGPVSEADWLSVDGNDLSHFCHHPLPDTVTLIASINFPVFED